jgi:endonuclease/exonuclease/phosphatase (EEP) superfamily protein YafD
VRRLSLVFGLVLLASSLSGWFGDRFWIAELASSVRVQLLVVAIAATVFSLAVRAPVGAFLAAVAVAVNVVVLSPLFGSVDTEPVGRERLVIAHVNLQRRALDENELRRALEERGPDLLFLLDPPKEWVRTHKAFAGYRIFGDGSPKVAAVVFAIDEPSRVGRPLVEGLPGAALVVERSFAGSPVWILGLHAQAPVTPHKLRKRDRTLRVAGLLAARHTGARIVLGDLNATPWSDALKHLERVAGLENSMEGRGVQASWPALFGPLGVPIDHFLSSGELVVIKRETGPTLGSTHRSVWVTVGRASAQ